MIGDSQKPEAKTLRYAAVLRISEALSACREPQQLTTLLADELDHVLQFDHLHVAILKEGSKEVEWHGWGKGGFPDPGLPIEEFPGWQVYKTQEPLHTPDWNKSDSFPRLKQFRADMGGGKGNFGSAVRVPLTTPHRRLGTLALSEPQVRPTVRTTSSSCN